MILTKVYRNAEVTHEGVYLEFSTNDSLYNAEMENKKLHSVHFMQVQICSIQTYVCTYMYVWMYVCMNVCVYYVCMYVCMHNFYICSLKESKLSVWL